MRPGIAALLLFIAASPAETVRTVPVTGEGASYWTRWRGPSGQGMVEGTNYVDAWSNTENVKWRMTVPGDGHSSPIVWKDHLFLTTSRDAGAKISMLAYNRHDGKLLWETNVPTTSGVEYKYEKNSHASATATTDGERIVRHARSGCVRLQRQDRVAPQVRRSQQLHGQRRVTAALQGPVVPVSGPSGQREPEVVCCRV